MNWFKNKKINILLFITSIILILFICLKIIVIIIFTDSPSSIYVKDKINDYNEQISFIFNLSDKFKIDEIGCIDSPLCPEYKLYKIIYGNNDNKNKRKYLFISGVHGNEPATVYAMEIFIQYLDSIDLLQDITIEFMYILNPYGFEYNYMYSSSNINIDRDYLRLKAQETKIFLNNIKDEKFDTVFDFHEDNSKSATGCYMFYYSRKNKNLINNMLENLRNNNVPINDNYKFMGIKANKGALYVPLYAKIIFMYLGGNAGAGLYFNKKNVEEVFVFETPTHLEMEKRIEIQLILLKYIISN